MTGGTHLSSEALRQCLFTEIPTEFVIEGSSMAPGLRPGDKVLLKPYDGRPLRAGHCYAFRDGSSMVFHRFVATYGEFAHFFGDNSLTLQTVPVDNIIGQVCEENEEYCDSRVRLLNWLFFKLLHIRRLIITKFYRGRRKYNEEKV